jgi:hypothetical protein
MWAAHQHARWLRPDAARYVRPDAGRYGGPNADIAPLPTVAPARRQAEKSVAAAGALDRSLRAFERDHVVLRRMVAELRLDLQRQRLARKYGYNPSQPRVPAGNPDGGQWTDGADGAGGSTNSRRIRLAGDIPTGEPPNIPSKRPTASPDRTAAIKAAAHWLARFGGPLGKLVALGHWLYEHDALIKASLDEPKSLDELRRAVSTPERGYDIHHIVEQASAERDGYPRSMIDGPDNRVRIPTLKHRDITSWYQTRNKAFGGLSPRDYLHGKS